MTRAIALAMLLAIVVPVLCWAAKKDSEQAAELRFLVLRQENQKPIRNASVVLHRLDKDGRQRDTMQLKTDSDGKASIDGMPYGRLRVQVIAPGCQTFGEDFDVQQPTMDFRIELKPPKEQLTIY